MDRILAVNSRRREGLSNAGNRKREVTEDNIIHANDGKLKI